MHEGVKFKPRSLAQEQLVNSINKNTFTFAVGYPGSGKTFVAIGMALSYLERNKISKIIIVRPAITNKFGEQVGSLPGELENKMFPFVGSVLDNIVHWLMPADVTKMVTKGIIEFLPVSFLRGRSFNNTFVIVEEAQNLFPGGVYMILSRIGTNSKCVFTGDPTQSDVKQSDLVDAIHKIKTPNLLDDFGIVELYNKEDIQRNPALYNIMQRFGIK